ncbi:MAG: type II secretion system F family protein [Candidatus Woesearchaeota archaeon]
MNLKIIYLEEFGKAFVPKKMRPHLRSYFLKAAITEVPYKLFGGLFYLSLLATFFVYFYKIYPLFTEETSFVKVFLYTIGTWIVLPLGITILLALLLYFYLDLKIFNRTSKVEAVLPDFLRFVSENLKGGMSFERALWSAIRPEFGILGAEVRLAAKRVMTGSDIEDALKEITAKYHSPTLRRSLDLIIEGMKGGGRTAYIIDKIVEDLEQTAELKAEMKATNLSYIIFVSVIVLGVAPALFALSYQFLQILISISAKMSAVPQGDLSITPMLTLGKVTIDPNTFKAFSRGALGIIALFSAMLISQISNGNIKGGVRIIPFFAAITQIIYTMCMLLLGSVFGNMIT